MLEKEPTVSIALNDRGLAERQVGELMRYAEETHAELNRKIPIWRSWYHCIPEHEVRNTPFQNASNIIWPLIRQHTDQLHAQRFNSLTASDRFWHAKPYNEGTPEIAKEWTDFQNAELHGRAYDLIGALHDGTHSSCLIGEGILRVRWGARERYRFSPVGSKPQLRRVRIANGPIIEHIKREYLAWEPGLPIHESPWVVRKVPISRQELESRIRDNGWDPEAVNRVLSTTPHAVRGGQGALESRASTPSRMFAPYWVYEILAEWPMTKGLRFVQEDAKNKVYPPVMIWADEYGHILYCGTYPYPTTSWNYYQLSLIQDEIGSHTDGLAAILEHMQAASTAMVNQAIDAITLSNAILGLTTNKRLVGQTFTPGQLTYVDDLASVNFDIKPKALVQPNVQLMQTIFAGAERTTGISDPGFGRESRMGGHPSPATNFVGMLQQGSLKLKVTLTRDRVEISRMGGDIAALYQAYFPRDEASRVVKRYGQKDAIKILSFVMPDSPIQELIDFDVVALNDALNPDVQIQRMIQIDSLASSYCARVIQATAAIPQALQQQFPPLVQVLARTIEIFTETYKNVLDAAQIDDPDKLLIRLQEAQDGTAAGIDRLREAATGALAQLSPNGQGPALPAVPAGVPVGGLA